MINVQTKELIQEAYELHQTGKLTKAEKLYQKLLEIQPEHVDALFLMGTLCLQRGNFESACNYFWKTLRLEPHHACAHNNLGTALHESGNPEEAIASYRKAIAIKPEYPDAYYNLGNSLKEIGKLDEAVKSYEQALFYRKDFAEAYYNLGNVFKSQHKSDKALESYKKAITLNPDYAAAHCNIGSVLQELGKIDEAIESYKTATTLKPDYTMAYCNLATAFQELGKREQAITLYKKALTLNPVSVMAYCNLGSAFQEAGLLKDAAECYKKAISLNPDYAIAYSNLGSIFQEYGHVSKAIEHYDRAIFLNPDEPTAHKNKAIALLLKENFSEGWQEYEWRLRTKDHRLRSFRKPKWNGSSLNGKTILIHAEQGFGDTIQFIRYLPLVKAQGGQVIFECPTSLIRLLANCAGIDRIIEQSPHTVPDVHFDFHMPLLSLPGMFGTTLDSIPSHVPYIKGDPRLVEKWHTRLSHDKNFKIGIAWAGNPTFKNFHNRSCSLSDFNALADVSGISYYSLQKSRAYEQRDAAPEIKITDLKSDLCDFADTAAVICNLDLVISTDTAVVHLAGAMDKPVWTLLHAAPDWRWWLKRTDSPWYPGMRLFRQTQLHNWTGVFELVKQALVTGSDLRGKPV